MRSGATASVASKHALVALIPALVLSCAGVPFLGFLLPATYETVDEAYQPLRSLKFFHPDGDRYHKWGPLPNFVYAPAYGVMLGSWYVRGEFSSPSGDYPYGFTRPHEQMGAMILVGRAIGLLAMAIALSVLCRVSIGVSGRPWSAALVVSGLGASSPWILHASTSIKPDGLMLAFLALALAAYTKICVNGFTRGAGLAFIACATLSISCKELPAPLFAACYAAVFIGSSMRRRRTGAEYRKFLADFAICTAAGVVLYLLINVVYAPETWLQRMENLLHGELKDPEVWAAPGQTTMSYLSLILGASIDTVGWMGVVLFFLPAFALVRRPTIALCMAMVPLVSHIVGTGLLAGYMPTRFMIPIGVALVVPVVIALGRMPPASGADGAQRGARSWLLTAAVVALFVVNAVGGIFAFLGLRWSNQLFLIEAFAEEHVDPSSTIHQFNITGRNEGSTRLSYLGYTVDDRLFGEIIASTEGRPEFIHVDRQALAFIDHFRLKPARAELYEREFGYDYSQFEGLDSLGYERVATLRSPLVDSPARWLGPLWPASDTHERTSDVYRRK